MVQIGYQLMKTSRRFLCAIAFAALATTVAHAEGPTREAWQSFASEINSKVGVATQANVANKSAKAVPESTKANKAPSTNRWKTLSKPRTPPRQDETELIERLGARIFFDIYGEGEPLILLHGGMGNSRHWGSQIRAFAAKYKVITIDSRGHGRSSRGKQQYSYHLMASDVLAVMDKLSIDKASIVGWSDGGVIGLDIAIKNPKRLNKLFVFGTNYNRTGMKRATGTNFGNYKKLAALDYKDQSQTPGQFGALVAALSKMWSSEPTFTDKQLKSIKAPVAVAVGEHDEIIKVDHVRKMDRLIPNSKLIIMKDVSHFGLWQDAKAFNKHVLDFLAGD